MVSTEPPSRAARAMALIRYHRVQGDRYLGTERTIEVTGLGRRRLNQLRNKGLLKAEKTKGERQRVRYSLDELERFVRDYYGWEPA